MSEQTCFQEANVAWNKCSAIESIGSGPDIEKQVCYIMAKLGYDRCVGNLKKPVHIGDNVRENARK